MNPFAQVGHANAVVAQVLESIAALKAAVDSGTIVLTDQESLGGTLDLGTQVVSLNLTFEVTVAPVV